MPRFFYAHAQRAAALGQMGQLDAARKAVQETLALRPDFAATARHEYAKWFEPEQVEHLLEGLRKAGFQIDAVSPARASSAISAPRSESGGTRADEGFWLACCRSSTQATMKI